MTLFQPRFRLERDAAALYAEHPPLLFHGHKKLVFQRAVPPGAVPGGTLTVTQWPEVDLPEVHRAKAETRLEVRPDVFDYAPSAPGEIDWHLNFADPNLFFAYGGPMFAQDEIQVAEHPLLASLREALEADDPAAVRTAGEKGATPILVRGVERRLAIDSREIYGQRFSRSTPEQILAALRPIDPPTLTNLIAISAPPGGRGRYRSLEIESILRTAYSGFLAAKEESGSARVVIHTGYWGCGAFGGNRVLTPLLQLLAARWAKIDRLVFHAVTAEGLAPYQRARALLDQLASAELRTSELISKLVALGFEWGVSDGN